MSDTDDAALVLAKVRETHSPDDDGRDRAARKLLEQLLEACQTAKLSLGKNDNVQWVSLSHPATKIWLGVSEGEVLVGATRDAPEPFRQGIEYDPLKGAYVAAEPNGPTAVTLLAVHVGRLLDGKAKAVAKGPPVAKEF